LLKIQLHKKPLPTGKEYNYFIKGILPIDEFYVTAL